MIRDLRLKHGWSQELLAEMSGVSLRTIQRAERGENVSVESKKSIASVFGIHFSELQENGMNTQANHVATNLKSTIEPTQETSQSHKQPDYSEGKRAIKKFQRSLATYLIIIGFLFFINWMTSPNYWWVVWPAMGWGIAIVLKAVKLWLRD